jgi:hypothetical protein
LIGGPSCTGVILSYAIPQRLRVKKCIYGQLFTEFASSSYCVIILGIYRHSTQKLHQQANTFNGIEDQENKQQSIQVPIVLTAPPPTLQMAPDDKVFVLIGVHTLARSVTRIQRFYRKKKHQLKNPGSQDFSKAGQRVLHSMTSLLSRTHSPPSS